MLKPVTECNGNFRQVINELYIERLRRDEFFYNKENDSFNKQAIIDYGNNAFLSSKKIIDVNANSKPTADFPKDSWLNKLSNFTVVGEQETDFYLTFKPHNGMMSLRRGFYKLLPIPKRVLDVPIENWQSEVLYTEITNNSKIYKYICNIGTLVNTLAVVGDLRLCRSYNYYKIDKMEVLLNIVEKTIYVSSAELVFYEDFNTHLKEVLWFTWGDT